MKKKCSANIFILMCFVASWSVQYSFCGSLVVRKGLTKTGLLIDWMVSRPAMLNGWKSYYKIQRWVIAVNTVYGKIVSENAIDILRQDHVQTYGDVVTWLLLLTLLEVIYTDIEAMNKVRRSASSCSELGCTRLQINYKYLGYSVCPMPIIPMPWVLCYYAIASINQ